MASGPGIDIGHIARTLGGAIRGAGGKSWRCRCPVHDGADSNLNLRLGDKIPLVAKCWSRHCPQDDILAELRRRNLLKADQQDDPSQTSRRREVQPSSPGASDAERTARALPFFYEALRLPGTPGALHFERRGVSYEGDALRWHPECPFGKGRVGCIVAMVRSIIGNRPVAIHRTAVDREGNKLSHLGNNGRLSLGPTKGGAIKLTDDADVERVLAIGEGLETTLSIRRLSDLEHMPLWCVLSADGIREFPQLLGIESVWIAADNDEKGVGQLAARALAQRLERAGTEAIVVKPDTVGSDLNDTVRGQRHA